MNLRAGYWQSAKTMYHDGVLTDAEMTKLKRRWHGNRMTAKQSRKDAKARTRLRALLERERAHLETMTANANTTELLKIAAPEHYDLLKAYFDRRIGSVWDG